MNNGRTWEDAVDQPDIYKIVWEFVGRIGGALSFFRPAAWPKRLLTEGKKDELLFSSSTGLLLHHGAWAASTMDAYMAGDARARRGRRAAGGRGSAAVASPGELRSDEPGPGRAAAAADAAEGPAPGGRPGAGARMEGRGRWPPSSSCGLPPRCVQGLWIEVDVEGLRAESPPPQHLNIVSRRRRRSAVLQHRPHSLTHAYNKFTRP